jgi:hypothetical protein
VTAPAPHLADLDPFDLPDWIGIADVTWTPTSGLRTGHHVLGVLTGEPAGHPTERAPDAPEPVPCDLLAVDEAYPVPVADDDARLRAHQAWRHGQILLVALDGRLTLAVPGTDFTADRVIDALSRLAKAVGAKPERYAAHLRIGADARRGAR